MAEKAYFTPSGGLYTIELIAALAIGGYIIYEYNKQSNNISNAIDTIVSSPVTLGGYISDYWNDPANGTKPLGVSSVGYINLTPETGAAITDPNAGLLSNIQQSIPQINGQNLYDDGKHPLLNFLVQQVYNSDPTNMGGDPTNSASTSVPHIPFSWINVPKK